MGLLAAGARDDKMVQLEAEGDIIAGGYPED
jgi:hypothetical protein